RATNARLAGLVTYLAIPLPYDAIARGRWGGLLMWAAAPWIVRLLVRAIGDVPFDAARRPRSRLRTIVAFGLLLAVLAAFVPFAAVVVPLVALALALGGVLVGQWRGSSGALVTALGATAVAVVAHLPWALGFVTTGTHWSAIGGVRSESAPLGIADILRFHTGPLGGGPVGFVFLVVAALPLVIGRDWRLAWATRAWTLALACWSLVWVGQQSWFKFALGPPEALLAPAAAALALSAALGVVAFEVDLRGYRFGWRQVAPLVTGFALALGIVPVLGSIFGGRWNAPDESFAPVLTFLHDDQAAAGPFRTVWIGDPDVLPAAGWRLDDGVEYAVSDHGLPTVEDRWAAPSEGPTHLLADALRLAEHRETSRLGRLLAPMGIRYLVVQAESAPGSDDVRPIAPDVERALAEQLDLQEVLVDPTLHVYRNAAFAPLRTELTSAAASAAANPSYFDAASAAALDLGNAPPLLTDHSGYTYAKGAVNAGSTMYLASGSSQWSLSVAGHDAPRTTAFGWANAFRIDQGGTATLSFKTPITRYALLFVQVAIWFVLLRALWQWRRDDKASSS
ncbi:MAG TPA: hypothetical protein VGZ52_02260, partial [Acidimicrobiales bacterium]|nr:hypothetical protein [Acidimicrobiales bacterium]